LWSESCIGPAKAYARKVLSQINPATALDGINDIKADALTELNAAAAVGLNTAGIGLFRNPPQQEQDLVAAELLRELSALRAQLATGSLTKTFLTHKLTKRVLVPFLVDIGVESDIQQEKDVLVKAFIVHILSLGFSKNSKGAYTRDLRLQAEKRKHEEAGQW
jgi:hypothetical protein